MYFLEHIWIIPLLPALGAAIMFFFGRRLAKPFINGICVGAVALAFVWAALSVWQYTHNYAPGTHGAPFEKVLYTWLGSGDGGTVLKGVNHGFEFKAEAGFLLDPLSSIWL